MFSNFWEHVKHDFMYSSFLAFVLILCAYFIAMKVNIHRYMSTTSRKPVHYKLFRPYDKSLISNAPSKREKQFYKTTNKITWAFNILSIAAFLIYLYLVFMR